MSASRFRRPTKHKEPLNPQPKSGIDGGWEEYRPATLRKSRKGLVNLPRSTQRQVRRAFRILARKGCWVFARHQPTLSGIQVSDELARKQAGLA